MVNKSKYIQKFKKLYELKTGKSISDDEALGFFENLVALVDAIYKPITQKNGK